MSFIMTKYELYIIDLLLTPSTDGPFVVISTAITMVFPDILKKNCNKTFVLKESLAK